MKKLLFVLLVLIIISGITYAYQQQNDEVVTIRVGYNVNSINHAPIMIAADAGFFTERGLDIQLVPLQSGKEIQQALGTGTIDFGLAAITNYFVPISNGAPIKIIAFSDVSATQMFIRPDSGIEKFSDLAGKNIAFRPGAGIDFGMQIVFNKENIKEEDVNFVELDQPLRLVSLMEKKIIDASTVANYEIPIFKEAGAVEFPEWVEKGYATFMSPRTVLGVNTDFLAQHEAASRKFVAAYTDAHEYIQNNANDAAQRVVRHITEGTASAVTPDPVETASAWVQDGFSFNVWNDPELLAEMSQVYADSGDIERALTAEDLVDTTFQEDLEDAQFMIYGTGTL